MPNSVLKFRDGFNDTSPHQRDEVKRLQKALQKAGFDVAADGLFGQGTQNAVRSFQSQHSLEADGVVGSQTWQALTGADEASNNGGASASLDGFRGNLSWIHAREGHAGKAYWPGGASGVTFDPGVDLGHARPEMIKTAYKDFLNSEQMTAAETVFGIKGKDAKSALEGNAVLQTIRINREQADAVFPLVIEPYWQAISNRFPALADSDTLPSVQTALLSIAYNRGARNQALEGLNQPLASKNWAQVADVIGAMQQDHRLEGIRKRRRMEADLIRNELA
ncbi:MAG: peptidoglycan-binding protein [bacterium]